MKPILNCIIVDDEPLARQGLAEYVEEIEWLHCIAQCADALQASEKLKTVTVDLMLLDIQMPGISGLDFLRNLQEPPLTIFTTAHPEFALEGFELDVVDYLVKPISLERFTKAATKARDLFSIRKGAPPPLDHFFVKSNKKFERIFFNDILFVEGLQNYVVMHLAAQKHIVYSTLTGMESQLPPDRFVRVHKSFIVALPHVSAIVGNHLHVGQTQIPVSRTLKDDIRKRILGVGN